jgi:hypothetical protein
MSAKVFISYRREDSAGHAGRVQDRLAREFGRDLLFMDVDGIPLGRNFVKVLQEEVAKCSVLLAVIGREWLGARAEDGTRRLDNPNDFVRVEIAAALQRDIPVIPILLDGTKVPRADQLPNDLQELTLRNGLGVRHSSFHADMDILIRELRVGLGGADEHRVQSLTLGADKNIPRLVEGRQRDVREQALLDDALKRTKEIEVEHRDPEVIRQVEEEGQGARIQIDIRRLDPKKVFLFVALLFPLVVWIMFLLPRG